MDQRRQPSSQTVANMPSFTFLIYTYNISVVDASTLKKLLSLLVINIPLSQVSVYFGVLFKLGPIYEL